MNKPDNAAKKLALSWNEIGLLCHGLALSSRPIGLATNNVAEEYSLGPRGAWILVVISSRYAIHPLELTKVFRVGRSLITAELVRLTDKKLVSYRKSERDGRRVELALTPLGEKVAQQVREQLAALVLERLSHYSPAEINLCARMLHDFIGPQFDMKKV